MNRSEFYVGLEFGCGGHRYRCTDVGSRVVVAIRVDSVEVSTSNGGVTSKRQLSGAEAEAQGWFIGPPYAVSEHVFDENDLPACTLKD